MTPAGRGKEVQSAETDDSVLAFFSGFVLVSDLPSPLAEPEPFESDFEADEARRESVAL